MQSQTFLLTERLAATNALSRTYTRNHGLLPPSSPRPQMGPRASLAPDQSGGCFFLEEMSFLATHGAGNGEPIDYNGHRGAPKRHKALKPRWPPCHHFTIAYEGACVTTTRGGCNGPPFSYRPAEPASRAAAAGRRRLLGSLGAACLPPPRAQRPHRKRACRPAPAACFRGPLSSHLRTARRRRRAWAWRMPQMAPLTPRGFFKSSEKSCPESTTDLAPGGPRAARRLHSAFLEFHASNCHKASGRGASSAGQQALPPAHICHSVAHTHCRV